MLLNQTFKTSAGAERRARFETAHSHTHFYTTVRCHRGEPDKLPFDRGRLLRGEYTWRLDRRSRTAA